MLKLIKNYKKLYKYYKKELSSIAKYSKTNLFDSFEYFIINLRILRDYYILTEDDTSVKTNYKLGSICFAIDQYEQYENCFSNYYNITNNCLTRIDKQKTAEETVKIYNEEKMTHLSAFLDILKDGMEIWNIDDNTI